MSSDSDSENEIDVGSSDEEIEYEKLILEKGVSFKGHDRLVTCALFFDQINRVVTSSNDKTIRFWDYENGVCLKVLSIHNNWVDHLIHWDDGDLFLSCSEDGSIKEISARNMKVVRTIFSKNDNVNTDDEPLVNAMFSKMAKMKNGRFIVCLSCHADDQVILVDYETRRISHTLEVGQINNYSSLVATKLNPENKFIVSYDRDIGGAAIQHVVLLIRITEDSKLDVEKEFFEAQLLEGCSIINSFVDSNGEEILMVGDDGEKAYFFRLKDPTRSSHFKEISLPDKLGHSLFKSSLIFSRNVRFSHQRHVHSIVTTDEGNMFFMDLKKYELVSISGEGKGEDCVSDIKMISFRSKCVELLVCRGENAERCLFQLPGSLEITEEEEKDYVERIMYIQDIQEEDIEEEERERHNNKGSFFTTVKLMNNNLLKSYKSFLLV